MADKENRDTNPKRKPRRVAVRLTRNLVLHYRKTANGKQARQDHHNTCPRQLYDKTKDEAWKKPIETLGVIVVLFYTLFAGYQSCQMREANTLTRLVLLATEAATLEIDFNTAWENQGVMLNVVNQGKLAATNLGGHIQITRERLPDYQIVARDEYDFGGDLVILPSSGRPAPLQRTFPMKGFSEKERQLVYGTKEIVIGRGSLTYNNGLNDTVSQSFCKVFIGIDSPIGFHTFAFHDCEIGLPWLKGILPQILKAQGQQK